MGLWWIIITLTQKNIKNEIGTGKLIFDLISIGEVFNDIRKKLEVEKNRLIGMKDGKK